MQLFYRILTESTDYQGWLRIKLWGGGNSVRIFYVFTYLFPNEEPEMVYIMPFSSFPPHHNPMR